MANPTLENIVSEIRRFTETSKDLISLQEFSVNIINERLSNYDWVGFYMLDPTDENVLVLGPYRGAPTTFVVFRLQKESAERRLLKAKR